MGLYKCTRGCRKQRDKRAKLKDSAGTRSNNKYTLALRLAILAWKLEKVFYGWEQ